MAIVKVCDLLCSIRPGQCRPRTRGAKLCLIHNLGLGVRFDRFWFSNRVRVGVAQRYILRIGVRTRAEVSGAWHVDVLL